MKIFFKKVLRKIKKLILLCPNAVIKYFRTSRAKKTFSKYNHPYKLNIGCGRIKFDSWINIDMSDEWGKDIVDVVWDATQPFPIPDASCEYIYNEHFIEHLTIPQALSFLKECHRLLKQDGVLRIATPSLETTVIKYLNDWRDQDWLTWDGSEYIKTRAEMLNTMFREWGHQWLYDDEELCRRLQEAGFSNLKKVEIWKSEYAELENRETRKDSTLIYEIIK